MFTLRQLYDWDCKIEARKGQWVPARPIIGTWRMRLRDAWQVLRGKADAFMWPGDR